MAGMSTSATTPPVVSRSIPGGGDIAMTSAGWTASSNSPPIWRSTAVLTSLLAKPTGIAVDVTRQEVLVADYGDTESGIYPRVQIFDYNGTLLSSISGRAGMMGNRFSRPQGLAVDGEGHIFMVASWLGRVMVFDREAGAELASLGTYGTDPGQLALPLDIVINADSKDVFVTNNRPRRVEVYVGGGVLP